MGIEKYWDKLAAIVKAHPKGKPLDKDGRFYPDPTPVAPPVGFTEDIDMFERVRSMVRREMSQQAASEGFETFEEADDFDVEDDMEPFSPYEMILEQFRPDGPVVNPEEKKEYFSSDEKAAPAPSEEPVPPSDGPEVRENTKKAGRKSS